MKKPYAIHVRPCKAMVISGVNFQDGDKFIIHRVVDSECAIDEAVDIPFTPCGEVLQISNTRNPIMIDMPGRYRAYPDGVVSDTAELWVDEISTCGD